MNRDHGDKLQMLADISAALHRATEAAETLTEQRAALMTDIRDEGIPLAAIGRAAGIAHTPSVSRIIAKYTAKN